MVTTRSQSKRHGEQEASPEPKPKVYDFSRLFSKHLKGLANAKTPDLEVHIGNEIFKVHKIILATGNDVFKAMFDSRMVESKNNSLEIKDCDPTAYRVFLSHLYSNQVRSEDISLDLLKVAEKYLDDSLKKRCFEVLDDGISVDNILETVQVATQFNYKNLIVACQKFVTENFAKLKGTPVLDVLLENKELVFEIAQDSSELLKNAGTLEILIHSGICGLCNFSFFRCTCHKSVLKNIPHLNRMDPQFSTVTFFFEDIEWSMNLDREDPHSEVVGINLESENKFVRANVRLTVLSEDPRFSNIVFELEKQSFGKHFFKVLDNVDFMSDKFMAYARRRGFRVVLTIKVLSSEDILNVSDEYSESYSSFLSDLESEAPE